MPTKKPANFSTFRKRQPKTIPTTYLSQVAETLENTRSQEMPFAYRKLRHLTTSQMEQSKQEAMSSRTVYCETRTDMR